MGIIIDAVFLGLQGIVCARPTRIFCDTRAYQWELMKVASTHGRTKYYSLNENSDFIEVFENLNNRLVEKMLGEEMLYQIEEYSVENLMRHEAQ
jgi:hypothetical protein